MGAQEKLIPIANIIHVNLANIPRPSSGAYKPPAKRISIGNNAYSDAVEFLANIYRREVQIASAKSGRAVPRFPQSPLLKRTFSPNVGIQDLTLGTILVLSQEEWLDLQVAISKCFNIIYPFDLIGPWTAPEITAYNDVMGVFFQEPGEGYPLFGADGSPLGDYAQGIDWANAWNDIKVPYDLSIGVITFFVAPIYQPPTANKYYYRFTGLTRWFDFTGYDSL